MGLREMLKNIAFSVKNHTDESKSVLVMCVVAAVVRVLQPFLGILMPKVVLDLITQGASPREFLLKAGTMAAAIVLLGYIRAMADTMANDAVGTTGIGAAIYRMWHKSMTIDYELLEDAGFKEAEKKAGKAMNSNHAPAMNIPRTLVELSSNVCGFVLYALVIATVHPAILLALVGCAALSWLMLLRARKYDEQTRGERASLFDKLKTLNDKLSSLEAQKDFRLYPIVNWVSAVYAQKDGERQLMERTVLTKQMQAQVFDAALVLLRDGAAYAILIWLVLEGRMSVGDFVYVFAAIGALAGWATGILRAGSDLFKAAFEAGDLRAVMEYPNKMTVDPNAPSPDLSRAPTLELRNVSYRYPKAEKPTLEGVSLTAPPGSSIAIVGANGAGKTTLVKLICGLYTPGGGQVLVNGIPSTDYNRDRFFELFSTVFQDIHLTANSIAENISQRDISAADMGKIRRCLELSGFAQKVDSLPEREKTLLVRQINLEATDLSGGEKQKLAMARAIYKDAPIVILDEPTAALDPIAENEVYNKYAELTRGKTSIFISHRLASTRFCDQILLIDGGKIAEQGTHDELMELGGIYANMFSVQASYYQKDTEFDWGAAK